jgi:hypothetical protein
MIRRMVIGVAALLWLAPAALAAEPVTISVALEKPDATACVGEPLALTVIIKNNTGKPLMIEDWERDSLDADVTVGGYPGGENVEALEILMVHGGGPSELMKNDFRELPPGETKVLRSVTPMIPGKAHVTVQLMCGRDAWVSGRDGKKQTWENGWKGLAIATLDVPVPAEPSPAMKKHYEDVQRQLDEETMAPDQKGRLLVKVGQEKHYFAARFLKTYAEKQPAGPLRDAAVWQLLQLAKTGTGYEAIPLLLGRMTDVNTNQDTRVAILDWAAAELASGATTHIAYQADYAWPEALKKQAREAIKKATEDPNPYLAQRAKDALRKLDEKQ